MRKFLAASIFLALLVNAGSGIVALAQGAFHKGETVYFKYIGEWREGRVKKDQDQYGVLVQIKDARTGQWGEDAMYEAPGGLRRDKPADFNEEGYGNAPQGLEGHMANAQFQPGQIVNFGHGGGMQEGMVVRQTKDGVLVKYKNWATGKYDGDFQAFHPVADLALGALNNAVPNVAVNPQPQPNPVNPQPEPNPNPAVNPQPQPQPNPAINPDPQPLPQQPQVPAQPNAPWEPPKNILPATPAGPAMTKDDVRNFLAQKFGGRDPFDPAIVPQREQIFKELEAMALKRGVAFTYNDANGDMYKELMKFGMPDSTNTALAVNQGAPVTNTEWYHGTWGTFQGGNPATREVAAFTGDVTIEPDGKYVWNTAAGTIEGTWRKATELEMNQGHKGGAGIVLMKAKGGFDFIAQEDDTPEQGGQNIFMAELKGRGTTERAGKM